MLDAGARDADRVDLLEGIIADHASRHLPGEHHQRHGIQIGVGDAGNGIGRAGTGGHQCNTGLRGGFSVTLGRMYGALLVSN
jgi:hypothetical protein